MKQNLQIDTDQIQADEYQRNLGELVNSDYNHLTEIEDLRCQRLPETYEKQAKHNKLTKIIILGDTGKHFHLFSL